MRMRSKSEYLEAIYQRYRKAAQKEKSSILDEFCKVCRYNRKYAIAKLNGPLADRVSAQGRRKRRPRYSEQIIRIIASIWSAAGYACSIKLKALIPLWLPSIRQRFQTNEQAEKQLLSISARQIDRRLASRKIKLKRRMYGRTKPGGLLKHQNSHSG